MIPNHADAGPAAAPDAAPHILLVDDDRDLRESVAEYLSGHGFRVTAAAHAGEARSLLRTAIYDLALLDVMMPGEDGLSLCRHLADKGDMPVIMLTARGEATDRIIGLEIGADDYVTKPFDPRELVARIRTVLRRVERAGRYAREEQIAGYSFDGWTLDSVKRALTDPEGVLVPLSSAEYKMLEVFVRHPRQVLNRDQLLDMVQGREAHLFDRAVDNQVSRLRKKIEADSRDPQFIQTVRGGGYMLAANVSVLGAGAAHA